MINKFSNVFVTGCLVANTLLRSNHAPHIPIYENYINYGNLSGWGNFAVLSETTTSGYSFSTSTI